MLSVQSKRTDALNFAAPLGTFIAAEYQSEAGNYSSAIAELNTLRENTVVKSPEAHESGVKALGRYYGQLVGVLQRFPLATEASLPGQPAIKITFTWSDTYEGGGVFSKKKVALGNAHLEQASVLFNLGALQSQVAAAQNTGFDDGLKTAAGQFQAAACSFTHLAALVRAVFKSPPTTDLQPALLEALASLMVAQAQETLWLKAVNDRMKDATVARLSAAAADFYDRAAKLVGGRPEVDKSWAPTATAKRHYFAADTQFRLANAAGLSSEYGEQVARLREAERLAQAAVRAAGGLAHVPAPALLQVVAKARAVAEKENQCIYLALVPDLGALAASVKHALVSADKALPDYLSAELRGADLFATMVPVAVLRASAAYRTRRDALVDAAVEALRGATAACVTRLLALQLPGALDAALSAASGAGGSEGASSVPDTVMQACSAVQAAGGVAALTTLLGNLPGLGRACADLYADAAQQLDTEAREDASVRAQYGARWTRTPSADITTTTRAQGDKYKALLAKAGESDDKVRARFREHEAGIVVLGQGPAGVAAALPPATAAVRTPDAALVGELRALLQRLDAQRSERETTEAALRDQVARDTASLSADLLAGSASDSAVCDQHLAVFAPMAERATALAAAAAGTLDELAAVNERFIASRRVAGDTARESALSDLAGKKEVFLDIKFNLEEGTKFYGNLATLLMKYQNQIKDFCAARKLEKQTMLADLSASIAASAATSYATHADIYAPSPPQQQQQQQQPQPQQPQQQPPQQQPPQQQPQQLQQHGFAPPARPPPAPAAVPSLPALGSRPVSGPAPQQLPSQPQYAPQPQYVPQQQYAAQPTPSPQYQQHQPPPPPPQSSYQSAPPPSYQSYQTHQPVAPAVLPAYPQPPAQSPYQTMYHSQPPAQSPYQPVYHSQQQPAHAPPPQAPQYTAYQPRPPAAPAAPAYYGGMAPITVGAGEWPCPRCTFHNRSTVSKCEMCDASRT